MIFKGHWEKKEVKTEVESRTSEDPNSEAKVVKVKRRKKNCLILSRLFCFLFQCIPIAS